MQAQIFHYNILKVQYVWVSLKKRNRQKSSLIIIYLKKLDWKHEQEFNFLLYRLGELIHKGIANIKYIVNFA